MLVTPQRDGLIRRDSGGRPGDDYVKLITLVAEGVDDKGGVLIGLSLVQAKTRSCDYFACQGVINLMEKRKKNRCESNVTDTVKNKWANTYLNLERLFGDCGVVVLQVQLVWDGQLGHVGQLKAPVSDVPDTVLDLLPGGFDVDGEGALAGGRGVHNQLVLFA